MKLLGIFENERSAILYEKRKPTGIFNLPRDFVYLRHVLIKNDSFIVLDKSIHHDEAPSYFGVARGEINFQIIHIKKLSK